MSFVRRYGRSVLATIAAVVVGVWWLLPARHVDGAGLAAAGLDDTVEVTLERTEPLTHKHPGAPIANGWVDGRLVLVRTDGGLPHEATVWGKLREPLPAEVRYLALKRKAGEDPIPLLLDASRRGHSVGRRLRALTTLLLTLGVWAYRFYRWRWADRRPVVRISLDGARPRDEAVVAAVVGRHAAMPFVLVFGALFLLSTLVISVLTVSQSFDVWRVYAMMIAFWAAVCLIGARRMRARLGRVVRDGALVTGRVVEATVKGRRTIAGYRPYVTRLRIALPDGVYRAAVAHGATGDAPDWAVVGTEVRAVTAVDERLAIVVTPAGDDLAARRLRR